jgi:hypothetical protein
MKYLLLLEAYGLPDSAWAADDTEKIWAKQEALRQEHQIEVDAEYGEDPDGDFQTYILELEEL